MCISCRRYHTTSPTITPPQTAPRQSLKTRMRRDSICTNSIRTHSSPTSKMSSDNNATAPNVTEEVTKNVPEQTEKPTTPDEETYTPSGTTEVWDSKKQQAFVESGELT